MIEIKQLYKSYGELEVLKDINLTVNTGEIYGLVGRSGAGKSTLLRCINGLENYQSGSLKIDGTEMKDLSKTQLREFQKEIGMIFQHFSLVERRNVYKNIALPMVSQLVSLLILWSKSSKVKLRMSTLLCGFWISCLSLTSSVWLCSKA